MIVFDLCCDTGHRFEGWFASSAEFDRQSTKNLVTCPQCGSAAVDKAPMAPAVPRKGNQSPTTTLPSRASRSVPEPIPAEVAQALVKLAQAQAKALETSRWVGKDFVEESRAMHYGEREAAPIHGQATMDEAQELLDEGIAVAPLLFPVSAPDEVN